jgi:hypothetical protein|tara:strand:+ start:151 stop:345 length:195 start_codon:yes stop_codon:yes gene_type:complete
MKYRIWNSKISRIIEAETMGSAWAAVEEDFSENFEIERLDNWDCDKSPDTEWRKDLLIGNTEVD